MSRTEFYTLSQYRMPLKNKNAIQEATGALKRECAFNHHKYRVYVKLNHALIGSRTSCIAFSQLGIYDIGPQTKSVLKREYGAHRRYYEEYTGKILNPEAVTPTVIIAQNYHLLQKERSPEDLTQHQGKVSTKPFLWLKTSYFAKRKGLHKTYIIYIYINIIYIIINNIYIYLFKTKDYFQILLKLKLQLQPSADTQLQLKLQLCIFFRKKSLVIYRLNLQLKNI